MTATFVQSKFNFNTSTATSIAVTLDATPTVGNLLVGVLTSNNSVSTPTEPWGTAPDATSTITLRIYSKIAGASEPATVTFSNATARQFGFTVMEFAPTGGQTWIGLDNSVTSTGVSVTSLAVGPTATLASTDDIAVCGIGSNTAIGTSTPTMSDGYTVVGGLDGTGRGFAGYLPLTSSAATMTTGTWTTSGSSIGAAIVTYKQSGAASGQNSGFLAIL